MRDTVCPICDGEAWWIEAAHLHCCIQCAAKKIDGLWYRLGSDLPYMNPETRAPRSAAARLSEPQYIDQR